MKVLKFGGTSVGSSQNIQKVIAILDEKSIDDNVICVVSAIGGITDKLLNAGQLAKNKDKGYETAFNTIKTIHFDTLSALLPQPSKAIITTLENSLQQLKELLNGIFLINSSER